MLRFFTLVFLSSSLLLAQPSLLYQQYQKGMLLSISENYQQALALFDSLQTEHPQEPGIYFFKASIRQSMMEDFFTHRWQDEFDKNFALAVKAANKRLQKDANDLDAHFFLGAALSYNSYEQVEDKNYFSGFKQAKEAVKQFRFIHDRDPDNCDVLLGLGMFTYFKSDATKVINWLPFIKDEHQKGLNMLHKTADCGIFLNWAAINNLAWIYIQRSEYEKAIELCEQGLQQFPNARFFMWPYARAIYKSKDYDHALDVYQKLLQSVESEEINNHYHQARIWLQMAKALKHLNKPEQALSYLQLVLKTEPDVEIAEHYQGKKREAAKLIGEINKMQLEEK